MRALLALAAAAATTAGVPASLSAVGNKLIFANGFVSASFDLQRAALDVVQGRFEGDGAFLTPVDISPNVGVRTPSNAATVPQGTAAGALAVVVTGNDAGSYAETSTSGWTRPSPLTYEVLSNTTDLVAFRVANITDAATGPRVSSTFTFTLAADSRSFTFNATVAPLKAFNATAVRVSTGWAPGNMVMMYGAGVRQGYFMEQPFIASHAPWSRWYAMGGGYGAVDISPLNAATQALSTWLFAGSWTGKQAGLDLFLSASPFIATDNWLDGMENAGFTTVAGNTAWPAVALSITPNNYDFPSSLVSPTAPNLPVNDIRAVLTGVYGSPMSALHSFDYAPEARMAPCINIRGNVCYGGDYNFYDPDDFLSVSAMLYSFDPAVHEQVRRLIETNGLYLCPQGAPTSRCDYGQMIHHFVPSCDGDPSCVCQSNQWNPLIQDCYTYQAISSASQSGPNIFWTMSALRYASVTGNATWLAGYMPKIRVSMQFLLNKFDASVGLFNVPGSLQIDTFIRQNYTSDTNAGIIMLLELAAEAETFLGNASGAAIYTNTAATVKTSMHKYLLAASGDHFCTNSNPVPGQPGQVVVCARDFVDYDANLLAVANGVATGALAQKILDRIDSGACAHPNGRGTYVSEIYYDASNCVGGNTGDSDITMGRISWADGLARAAMGDAANAAFFESTILAPLQYDLLSNTWMYERYNCQGQPTHNAFYVEMPETVAMLLIEAKYGIKLGLVNVTVAPIIGTDDFNFAMGPWTIGYHNNTSFTASLPYAGSRTFVVKRMQPGTYTVTASGASAADVPAASVVVGADGILSFHAATGVGVTVTATLN